MKRQVPSDTAALDELRSRVRALEAILDEAGLGAVRSSVVYDSGAEAGYSQAIAPVRRSTAPAQASSPKNGHSSTAMTNTATRPTTATSAGLISRAALLKAAVVGSAGVAGAAAVAHLRSGTALAGSGSAGRIPKSAAGAALGHSQRSFVAFGADTSYKPGGDVGFDAGTGDGGFDVGVKGYGAQYGVLGTSHGSGSGVHGEGTGSHVETTGVTGHSEKGIGVAGRSTTGIGLSGECAGNGTAVKATSTRGIGVVASGVTGVYGRGSEYGVSGSSDEGYGISGFSGTRSGVTGATRSAEAAGIHGTSASLHRSAIGVEGSVANGLGVSGFSDSGTGMRGESSAGRGGVFAGGTAPLRLVPSRRAGPPKTGAHEKGDIFLDRNGGLYVCVKTGTPGTWKRIVTE